MSSRESGAAPKLSAQGLSKRYGHVRALEDASIDLWPGEIVALVGANGAGKSTLIKIVSGLVGQDEGVVAVDGGELSGGVRAAREAGIAVVHQELNLVPTASVAENVLLWRLPRRGGLLDGRAMRRTAQRILDELDVEIDLDMPAALCTSVEQRLVMVASALSQEATVLILDEPTAALPPHEAGHVLDAARRLRALGKTVVFVSHRLNEVCELSDRAIVMRDGRVVNELRRQEIQVDALIEMVGGSRLAELDAIAAANTAREPDHELVMDVRGLAGRRVKSLDVQVRAGEILGVAGLVGAGRSELLRLIAHVQQPLAGEWVLDADRVGYVGERRSHSIFYDFDVAGNLSLPSLRRFRRAGLLVRRRAELRGAREVLDQLRVKGEASTPVWALSGGNQQKVLLGRWLMSGAKVLVLDEPTVGIDVGARAEVHSLLREAAAGGRGVVVAIADPEELLALCDRVLVLAEGRLTLDTAGPFEEASVLAACYAHAA